MASLRVRRILYKQITDPRWEGRKNLVAMVTAIKTLRAIHSKLSIVTFHWHDRFDLDKLFMVWKKKKSGHIVSVSNRSVEAAEKSMRCLSITQRRFKIQRALLKCNVNHFWCWLETAVWLFRRCHELRAAAEAGQAKEGGKSPIHRWVISSIHVVNRGTGLCT